MSEAQRTRNALVIVPTYNERPNIDDVVRRLFEGIGHPVDLLVVDDSSPDGTAAAVKAIAARREGIHLLERPARLGLGSAYVDGFTWALGRGYDAVVEMDGDLSHDPAMVPKLLDGLGDADLAIGSRYTSGGRVENWGVLRRLLSRTANIYARAWLGYPVKDSTAGFRAYSSDTLRKIDLQTVRSEGYAFQIELTRRVFRAGGRIAEVPITFAERARGKSKMTLRIVAEALIYVALWGARDRLTSLMRFVRRAG